MYKLLSFLYRWKLLCINKWGFFTYRIFAGDINVVHKIIKIVKDETMSEFRNGV